MIYDSPSRRATTGRCATPARRSCTRAPHQTPEQIVETAIQEDAHAIGGAHLTLFPRVIELLARRDANDIVVFGVGIIPADDIAEWETLGVARIFTLGATTASIVGWVPANVPESVA